MQLFIAINASIYSVKRNTCVITLSITFIGTKLMMSLINILNTSVETMIRFHNAHYYAMLHDNEQGTNL